MKEQRGAVTAGRTEGLWQQVARRGRGSRSHGGAVAAGCTAGESARM